VSNEVLSLLVTEKDMVWAGTVSGLSRLDRKTGRFDHFRRQDGLSSEAISGILEGPGAASCG
jgi:ligand-binding sensor domain-containing protein